MVLAQDSRLRRCVRDPLRRWSRILRWRILAELGAAVVAVAGSVGFVEIDAVGWIRVLLNGPETGVVWCEDSWLGCWGGRSSG